MSALKNLDVLVFSGQKGKVSGYGKVKVDALKALQE